MSENIISRNTHAKNYDEASKKNQLIDGKKFIDCLSFIKTTDHVLDIGCGTGELAEYTAKNKVPEGRVTAFDPDKQRIKVAKENLGGVQNISFHEGTALEFLKDQDNLYDVMYSNYVLNWVPKQDLGPMFAAMYKAAKKGGIIAHQYVRGEPEFSINVRGLMSAEDNATMDSMFFTIEPKYLDEIAAKCGFETVSHEETIIHDKFNGLDEFFRWLEATCHGRIPFQQRYDDAIAKGTIETELPKDSIITSPVYLLRMVLKKTD